MLAGEDDLAVAWLDTDDALGCPFIGLPARGDGPLSGDSAGEGPLIAARAEDGWKYGFESWGWSLLC